MLRGKWQKKKKKKGEGNWHPASTHSGKSKCQWAHHENVHIFKRFMATIITSYSSQSPNCPTESLPFISMKTRLELISRMSCFKNVTTRVRAVRSTGNQFVVSFMLAFVPRLWITLYRVFVVFLTMIEEKKKSPYSWEFPCFVLVPPADSYQCRFNVIIWIEQSSWRQRPIFTVQIEFLFSYTAKWIEVFPPSCLPPSLSSICCSFLPSSINLSHLTLAWQHKDRCKPYKMKKRGRSHVIAGAAFALQSWQDARIELGAPTWQLLPTGSTS